MRISGLRPTSLFDGIGINYVIFAQGCGHHCPHCHNKSTWDFNGGVEISLQEIINGIKPYLGFIDGITFSGGDPVYQMDEFNVIAGWAKAHGLRVTLYTGFTLDELRERGEYLGDIDYIIDGSYEDKKNTTELPFRGSSNQKMYMKLNDKFIEVIE